MPGGLYVYLGTYLVGTLTNLPGDSNLFVFEDAYVNDFSRPTLSQGLLTPTGEPMRIVPRTHTVAPPFFANLLPEGDSLLRTMIAKQQHISIAADFPFLNVLGRDLPGAIIMTPVGELESTDEEPSDGKEVVDRPIRFSLAGIQLKFSASLVANRVTIPLSGRGGSWIVKLPTNAFPRLPENEHAIMEFGRLIGLEVPLTRLVAVDEIDGLPSEMPALRREEPRLAYVIERFDRGRDGVRIHVEDLNQVANQNPADKYENRATHWVANVFATLCPPEDLDEFIRRLVFGVCIGNDDMHLKNWAIIYPDRRNARIAPLYDFVCSRLYYPKNALALTIGGERTFERVSRKAMTNLANSAEISSRRTLAVVDETVDAIRSRWPTFKEQITDPDLIQAIERQFEIVPLMRGR